jgi:predicted ATP-grasp superfamily ATP-dependent carboligase
VHVTLERGVPLLPVRIFIMADDSLRSLVERVDMSRPTEVRDLFRALAAALEPEDDKDK